VIARTYRCRRPAWPGRSSIHRHHPQCAMSHLFGLTPSPISHRIAYWIARSSRATH